MIHHIHKCHFKYIQWNKFIHCFDLHYRCEMENILLEMDRILRPEGSVILRDDVDILVKIRRITDGLNWDSRIVDHEDGPNQREKLLFAVKLYWTAPAAADQEAS